ncbi:MAG: hypothetical protein IIC39_07440, partial [Candidatus Marinimicrobia bacterium]|nr:hypothetical protein [Candidatus Neomarinimicrobiota bacterium]
MNRKDYNSLPKKTTTPDDHFLRIDLTSTLAHLTPLLVKPMLNLLESVLESKPDLSDKKQFENLKNEFLNKMELIISKAVYIGSNAQFYPGRTQTDLNNDFNEYVLTSLISVFNRFWLKISLTDLEKLQIYKGMLHTRYLDARLKKFFMSSEIKTPDGTQFQGKGFRSMGQEAIYAAGIRLKRNTPDQKLNASYDGDYVAPMIRDLGLALAMGQSSYDVLAAQMGKVGKPMNGKDFHIGDFDNGILPPSAPISISSVTSTGIGFALKGSKRVILNCTGEGATSTGEWHEAINFAAVHKLPIVFIVQNNQSALSTPTNEQYASNFLAEKAKGYGIRGVTIDGSDAEVLFAAVTEAAESCRNGDGPVLVELICMRFAGHAHHDDMLYFGIEPDQFIEYPAIAEKGYIDKENYELWSKKDPIALYKKKLKSEGILDDVLNSQLIEEISTEIETAANKVIDAAWPEPENAGDSPFYLGEILTHTELLSDRNRVQVQLDHSWQDESEIGFTSNPDGKTFWEAIVEALREELKRDSDTFILGEDVGGKYGNAFVILKSLLNDFGERIINTPLSESAIIGVSVGAALLGKRPIAEIQFNDFIASGFNQLVNNAAMIHYRWGHSVPMTIRMPWGGLRQAGPYHSQNTEPWFYRTPGLKIVCPSTPIEAKGLLKSAIRDDNPVLFYEHIALYRATGIRQILPSEEDDQLIPLGTAHLKSVGKDITIITYGAFVHRCLSVVNKLQNDLGISSTLLDLRSLIPLDKNAILSSVVRTGKVLIVTEDSKRGSIGQSVASIIAEEVFEYLDAPVRVLGALDTPVPYSPPLEEEYLISEEQIFEAAKLL